MDIIKETIQNVLNILLEGRLEDVKAKYGENMSNIIDNLSQSDPSGNNKYLDWMAKVYQENPQTHEIIELVKGYHENLQRLTSEIVTPIVDGNRSEFPGRAERRVKNNPKDINSYPSYKSLLLIVNNLEETRKESPSRDKIYQDSKFTVIVPKTYEVSCKYGRHSNWCVSTSNNQYFDRYTKERDALLFFILWRDKRDVEDVSEYKVAINVQFIDWNQLDSWDWYDKKDNKMDPNLMLNIFPNEMIDTIQKYLLNEGKRLSKIIDKSKINKLIKDNAKHIIGIDNTGGTYLFSDKLKNFQSLLDYPENHKVDNYNSKNSIIYISKDGNITVDEILDIWSDDAKSRVTRSYERFVNYYNHRGGFLTYLLEVPRDLVINPIIVTLYKDRLMELLQGTGFWVERRADRLNVGDKIRWKKGRGWEQRYNSWNESVIDRETPSGYFVTGKTEEFPNGKRFKPTVNLWLEVYVEFSESTFN